MDYGGKGARLVSESDVAEALGISRLAVRVLNAAGAPGGQDYGPVLHTAQECAAWFQVSTTTLQNWKGKGCPMAEGYYPIAKMLAWRRRQADPDERPWWATGNRRLKPIPASGDMARAILRVLRADLAAVFRELPEGEDDEPGEGLSEAISHVLATWLLDDDAIEQLVADSWSVA